MTKLMVTRFNNITENENSRWRDKYDFNGCVYNSPVRIKDSVPLMINLIIIEMNNDKNKIIGFGKIKNKVYTDRTYRIYQEGNYNRYTYRGAKRINIENINNKDIQEKIQKLEERLFKGKSHLKRGQGITQVSDVIGREYLKIIEELFILTT